jgi:hypothetical protein
MSQLCRHLKNRVLLKQNSFREHALKKVTDSLPSLKEFFNALESQVNDYVLSHMTENLRDVQVTAFCWCGRPFSAVKKPERCLSQQGLLTQQYEKLINISTDTGFKGTHT